MSEVEIIRVGEEPLSVAQIVAVARGEARLMLDPSPDRREGVRYKEFIRLFDVHGQKKFRPQRPGFNTQCADGNHARWGFCANVPVQECQDADGDDADGVIGFGIGCASLGAAFFLILSRCVDLCVYFQSGVGLCRFLGGVTEHAFGLAPHASLHYIEPAETFFGCATFPVLGFGARRVCKE